MYNWSLQQSLAAMGFNDARYYIDNYVTLLLCCVGKYSEYLRMADQSVSGIDGFLSTSTTHVYRN